MSRTSPVAKARVGLFILGVVASGTAGFLFFTAGPEGPSVSAALLAIGGGMAFLAALVLSFIGAPPVPETAPPAPVPKAARPYDPTFGEVVDIKRTEMHWKTGSPESDTPHVQAQLDDLEGQMQELKVKLGMGQISNESYKRMMAELREARVKLELSIHTPGKQKPERAKSEATHK